MSLISIVLPTCNGSRYLRQSIDSCLAQTHQEIELIIVDDASTDETPCVVASYRDERVKYIRHETNKQLPTALNTGFAHASGAYLTWTSDDNLYTPNAVERMLEFLRSDGCGLVYCDYYEFEDDNRDRPERIYLPAEPAFDRINCVRACFLYSREVMKAVGGYDPDTWLAEDYDYWIRVWRRFRMGHLAEPLYFYRRHAAALFSSRYQEVQVAKYLVRFKHDIMDAREVADALVRQLAGRRSCLPHFRRVDRLITRVQSHGSIHRKLRDFKEGRVSFARLRADLNTIVNGGSARA